MSDHVSLELADFLENRLSPERRVDFQRHIEVCAACAAELAFALRFREGAVAEGLAHPRPDRLVALAAGSEEVTEIERRHLESCPECRVELEWASAPDDLEPTVSGGHRPRRPGRSQRPGFLRTPRRTRTWLSVAAVLVVAAIVLVPRFRDDSPRFADLIAVEPLPVLINRGAAAPDSFATARLRGLEFYRDGDYAGAGSQLQAALDLRPGDAELLLYLGSSELMLGNPDMAAKHLEEGRRGATNDALREEIDWQLANALLRRGSTAEARRVLEQVVATGGDRAGDAQRILNTLP